MSPSNDDGKEGRPLTPVANLFDRLPEGGAAEEEFLPLAGKGSTRIERIVSQGHTSPADGGWDDPDHEEWVIVLRGAARIEFEVENREVSLGPGDYLTIPAHARHRVSWTDPERETVWLAVHYDD